MKTIQLINNNAIKYLLPLQKNKNPQLTSFVILHFNNKFQVYVIMCYKLKTWK